MQLDKKYFVWLCVFVLPYAFANCAVWLCSFDKNLATAQNAYELWEAALQLENYEEAIKHFASAEKSRKTLARLGYAYSQLGRYADATRAYQDVLRSDVSEKQRVETEIAMSQAFIVGVGVYRFPTR